MKKNGSAAGKAAGEYQPAGGQAAEHVLLAQAIERYLVGTHALHDGVVQRSPLAFLGHPRQQPVELVRDERTRVIGRAGPLDLQTQAKNPASLEELAQHVKHSVDQAPGQVATEDGDQHFARAGAALLLDHQARAERERQRHDQAEQDLAHPRSRIEVFGAE